jgi:sugar phosphate isomerase/epimerase
MAKSAAAKGNLTGVFLECVVKKEVVEAFAAIHALGLDAVQITTLPDPYYSREGAAKLKRMLKENHLTATSTCMIFEGERYDDFATVARTVGYRPEQPLAARLAHSRRCVDLAARLGAPVVTTHIGVLPKAEEDPVYQRMLAAVREIAAYAQGKGVQLSLETGQETGGELVRFLDKVADLNVGVNFDPANLVLYGMDDPPAALARVYEWVTSVHMKDGFPPARTGFLGVEARLGEGRAQVAECLQFLKDKGFRGPLIIENYVWVVLHSDPLDEILRAKEFVAKHF